MVLSMFTALTQKFTTSKPSYTIDGMRIEDLRALSAAEASLPTAKDYRELTERSLSSNQGARAPAQTLAEFGLLANPNADSGNTQKLF